jgi:hypothetical protein
MTASQNNPAIVEAWGYYEVLSAEEEARLLAESREKARMDFEDRYDGARKEGREAVTLNCLQKMMPHEVIAEVTGFSIEEIQRLEATLSDFYSE